VKLSRASSAKVLLLPGFFDCRRSAVHRYLSSLPLFSLDGLLLRLSMNLSFRRLDCIYAAVNSGIKRRRGLRASLLNRQAASFGRSNCAEPTGFCFTGGLVCMESQSLHDSRIVCLHSCPADWLAPWTLAR